MFGLKFLNLYLGTFFGGKFPAISWWRKKYYEASERLHKAGFFVGKDQDVMNQVIAHNHEKCWVIASWWHCSDA